MKTPQQVEEILGITMFMRGVILEFFECESQETALHKAF